MTPALYWIEGPWKGRLAISSRPRGNDWLEEEIKGWRESGVSVVATLLTRGEVEALGLIDEARICQEQGIELRLFPIEDRSVPVSRTEATEFIRSLEKELAAGKNVAVHCRQGLGRSAIISGGLLVISGLDPQTAIERVTAARGCPVPETPEQSHWVAQLAQESVQTRR
jgi:protein-tyrosine phosphatase